MCTMFSDVGMSKNEPSDQVSLQKHVSVDFTCSQGNVGRKEHDHSKYFHLSELCIFNIDKVGILMTCRNGAHLWHCQHFECSHHFKCSSSYCIPYSLVCNGRTDCQDGVDEIHCKVPCPGMHKCRKSTICVHSYSICDGENHCPLSDDEELCDVGACPNGCNCSGYSLVCILVEELQLEKAYFEQIIQLSVHKGNVSLDLIPLAHSYSLVSLNMSDNRIKNLHALRQVKPSHFSFHKLVSFDVSKNLLSLLFHKCFSHLFNTKMLVLQNNKIYFLQVTAFYNLSKLTKLDLAHNSLGHLNLDVFRELQNLKMLHLEQNVIEKISFSQKPMLGLATLKSSTFRVCCFLEVVACKAPPNQWYSSCKNLLQYVWLKIFVWLISLMSIGLNVVSLMLWHARVLNCYSLVVQYISFSDTCCGLYLLAIAGTDSVHKHFFAAVEAEWQKSFVCILASIVSMFSLVSSATLLLQLSVMRFVMVKYPFNTWFKSKNFTMKLIGMGYATSLSMTVLSPLHGFSSKQGLENSLCLQYMSLNDSKKNSFSSVLVPSCLLAAS